MTKIDRSLALDTDLDLIRQHLRANPDIGLIVIDPITSYLGKADLNKEQRVREVLGPVKELCEETGVTIIALGHFNKRSDVGALHRVGGAVAMAGLPRAVWLFVKDPDKDGEHMMLLGKGNLTRKRTGLRYGFGEQQLPTGSAPYIAWKGETQESDADSVLNKANDPKQGRKPRATEFLREYLAAGAKLASDMYTAAEKEGISHGALWAVKNEVGVTTAKVGKRWWWSLSKGKSEEEENCPF